MPATASSHRWPPSRGNLADSPRISVDTRASPSVCSTPDCQFMQGNTAAARYLGYLETHAPPLGFDRVVHRSTHRRLAEPIRHDS
jgi:hypothetical protein